MTGGSEDAASDEVCHRVGRCFIYKCFFGYWLFAEVRYIRWHLCGCEAAGSHKSRSYTHQLEGR